MSSSYVLAGFDGLTSIIERFIENSKEYSSNFTRKDICNFFNIVCNKFLHSYGQNFKGKKKYDKYNKKEADLFINSRTTGFYDNSELIVDSGAFQISMGILNKVEGMTLFDMYYDFLQEYIDIFDRAFILDLPPGPGCDLFNDFNDVYNLNLKSFERAANLPDKIRSKIIYIHHFRTPKIWEICTKILDTDDMFNKFQYFATGGIAANMSGDMIIPCIIYVLPLIPLLNRAKKYGRNKLSFHILGGSNYRDILFYELFKKVVLDEHKIELTISYDSSTIFKNLMIGRHIPILDEGIIRRTDLKSSKMNFRFNDSGEKIENAFIRTMLEFSNRYGFKEFNLTSIYDLKTGTFFETVRIYAMLYYLSTYYEMENLMRNVSNKIYPFYKSGDLSEFNKLVEEQTRKINNNKITKKQTIKSYSLSRSLDMLKNLDEDHCKYIVESVLVKDEFTELMNKKFVTF